MSYIRGKPRASQTTMVYMIIADDNGLVASKSCRFTSMMSSDKAVKFVNETFPGVRVYQQLERAPRGARPFYVYYSKDAKGNGRIGRNWEPLMVERPTP